MAKVVTLSDMEGLNTVYPRTRASAVYSPNNIPATRSFMSLEGIVEIGENADLNSYKYRVIGNYYVPSDAVLSTISNAPEHVRLFHLHVKSIAGFIAQEIHEIETGYIYYRSYNLTTKEFSNWVSLTTSESGVPPEFEARVLNLEEKIAALETALNGRAVIV